MGAGLEGPSQHCRQWSRSKRSAVAVALLVLKSYFLGGKVRGEAWRTLCSSLNPQSMHSASVLEAWYMKAVDASCPRVVRRLSASLFQSFSDLLRFI